ncbi:peroxiredoxin [Candidatus Pelagibacter bacterium]|nr:peroxiredoxin [Candidatus Pelagibacter bacterium]
MKIKERKKAPSFKLPCTSGVDFNLNNIKGKLLIYFYPKDDTPGCTLETKDFAKLYGKFKKIKCELVGVSKDSLKSHEKFKKKYKVPFELLSDSDTKMQKKYGIWGPKSFMGKKFLGTIRSTVFINKGKIKKIWSNVRVKNHAQEVFEFVKTYK